MPAEAGEYRYQDTADHLTRLMIEELSTPACWERSEQSVFAYVLDKIKSLPQPRKCLDVGCGTGRLFPLLASYCSEYVGVEPDAQRQTAAEKLVAGQRGCRVLRGGVDSVQGESFDIIVCSHVLQHMAAHRAQETMRGINRVAAHDALLAVTVSFTAGEEDRFQVESQEHGQRRVRDVDAATFNAMPLEEGELPIRFFSRGGMTRLLEDNGFEVVAVRLYHYALTAAEKQRGAPRSTDLHRNLHPEEHETARARDALFLARKKDSAGVSCWSRDSVDAKVSVSCYVRCQKELTKEMVLQTFPRSVSDDGSFPDEVLDGMAVTRKFLYASGLRQATWRMLLGEARPELPEADFACLSSQVLVTYFRELQLAHITCNVQLTDITAQTLIFVKQLLARRMSDNLPFIRAHAHTLPVPMSLFLEYFQAGPDILGQASLVEITACGGHASLSDALAADPRRIYGILAGDEGWTHVPLELARKRTRPRWGSREFLALLTLGANFVLFNLAAPQESYRRQQDAFARDYYGSGNPYYALHSPLAGLTSGVFYAVEQALAVKSYARHVLQTRRVEQEAGEAQADPGMFQKALDWCRTAIMREDFDKKSFLLGMVNVVYKALMVHPEVRMDNRTRNQLRRLVEVMHQSGCDELQELQRVVARSVRLGPLTAEAGEALERLEASMRLNYEVSTNAASRLLSGLAVLLALALALSEL